MKSVKIKVPYTNFPLKSIQSIGYSEASLGKIVELKRLFAPPGR
jgi:hypothetical protein